MKIHSSDTTKFQEGNVYEMRYIGDSELKPEFICIKRTEKTATFETFMKKTEKFTRKIKTGSDGIEFISYASYSMAPVIRANRITQ